MKHKHLSIIAVFFMITTFGCATNYKAQLNALSQFNYSVSSIDQLQIAGRDFASFVNDGGSVNMSSLPGLAFAILQENLPLQGRINLQVANPTNTFADINEFKYLVELSGKPLFEGTVAENIRLKTGESMVVPLTFHANIFGMAKEQGFEKFLGDVLTRKSDALLALKIKPSIRIGNKNYFYPGYITIDKDLGKSLLRLTN